MVLNYRLYLERAGNELKLADIILKISQKKEVQYDILEVPNPETYFNSVISHAYYCIFYCAKSYLLTKGIKTESPEEHKKTYEEFKKFVDKGIIDVELLKLYEKLLLRAETLLEIFWIEKKKRGEFTYQKIHQANLEPAKESLENAKIFFKHIYNLCEKC